MGQITLDIQDELQALKSTVGKCNDEIANLTAKNAKLEAQNLHLEEQNNQFEDRHLDAEKAISELQRLVEKKEAAKRPSSEDADDGFVSMNFNAYTFLYTSSIWSGPYMAGLMPCGMQYIVFSLFLLDLLKTTNVPPGVATIVRACQIMAIIIAFLVETDMPRALRAVIYREGFEEMKTEFDDFRPWKFYASNALMGLQGLLSKVVAFFLIIFADNVFDLLLNFTAIMFVSELDEIVFMLSKAGYLGMQAERLTKKIEKKKLPQKPPEGILEHLTTLLYGLALVVAFVAFAFIARWQDSQESLADFVKVQFGDEVDPTLGLFSGCYEKQLNDGWDARVRYVPTQANRGPGEFEYCLNDGLQTWVFANEASETACNGKFVLRSAEERSTSFDLLDAKGDQWLLRTGNPISEFLLGEVDPERYEIECGNMVLSGSSGTSSDELCPILTVDADAVGFSDSYDWSRSFLFLENSKGEILQFFQHPVFVGESSGIEGYEVIFFAGRRWVLTSTARLLPNNIGVVSKIEIGLLFETAADFWLLTLEEEDTIRNHKLAYLSEAVGQANDRGTPLGLQWYNARYADGIGFPFADISRPIDASFRCGKCNGRSNPCLYQGICEEDGTCTCRHGASGKLCEIKPLGDGVCNPYFNTEPDGYDGGDCCVGSCSETKCGVNGMSFAFGQNLKRIGIGFPNCADPSMVPLTIRLQTEIEKAQSVFFESYTIEVLCEGGAKAPLRVSLDPGITGSLNETLYVEDKSGSCLMKFIGIRSTSGLKVSYQIFDGVDSSQDSMLLMSGESNITSDDEFVLPTLYSRCLKDALAGGVIDQDQELYTGSYQDRAFAWLSDDVPKNAECSSDEEYLIERYALVALSTAEEAPESWISSSDHCLWPRVKCDGSRVVEYTYDGQMNGRLNGTWAPEFTLLRHLERLDVAMNDFTQAPIPIEISELTALTALIMPDNGRSGSIPSALFELSLLEEITMAVNTLTGSVPSVVGQLGALRMLTLRINNLSGTIPSEVGNLKMLAVFELAKNGIVGSIPSEIGNMSALTALSLFDNSLSGTLPSEIGNLSLLNTMQLEKNAIAGSLPSEICNLRALTALTLRINSLSGSIPSEVGNLSSLNILDLGKNGIVGSIPSEIGNCALTGLSLSDNSLSGTLPSEIGNLSLLNTMQLYNNSLTGNLPSELGNMRALTKLQLASNALTGAIPSEVGNLTSLETFFLYTNALTGSIPSEFWNLKGLVELDLHNNTLSGSVPTNVGNLQSLTALGLYNNALSGTVPLEIGNLTSLTVLALKRNAFSGRIPSEVGNLRSLTGLHMYANALSGTVPSELGRCTDLQLLALFNNALEGTLHSELGRLSALRHLRMDSNALSGPIPSEVGNLSALAQLTLFSNALSGNLPSEIGNLSALTKLALFSNALSGNLPSEVGNMSSLAHLDLQNNALSGSLPSGVGNLSSLTALYLHLNNLSGTVPTEIWNLKALHKLSLADMTLSGSIPTEIGNMNAVVWLNLGGNALSGSLPSELGNLSGLTTLELQDNALSGTLPSAIGNLSGLTDFFLSSNSLSGTVPSEIGRLSALTALFLDNNALSGRLPTEIGKLGGELLYLWLEGNLFNETLPSEIGLLTNLQHLVLDDNALSGPLPSEIGLLEDLVLLNLRNNLFNETLPSEIGTLTNLEYLALSQTTNLSGSIPSEIGLLNALVYLDMTSNALSGTLPTEIGKLDGLYGMYLKSNSLSGTIPSEIGNLISLTALGLHDNALSGSLPMEIGNLENLFLLNLRDNFLNETLPSEIGLMTSLEYLMLSGNKLSGLPTEILKLPNLKHLELSGNLFGVEDFPCDEVIVEIMLTTDGSPSETSWEIAAEDGAVFASRDGGFKFGSYVHEQFVCVPLEACKFILLDSYEDGGPSVQITRLGKDYQIHGTFTDKVELDICV